MKMITRTIYEYDHMVVKFQEDGTFDQKHIKSLTKLGARKIAEKLKEMDLVGYSLVKVEPIPVKYAMSIDVFMENATKIEEE